VSLPFPLPLLLLRLMFGRNTTHSHSSKQGTRNATKKRNKYGKVERVNLKHDW
jgi:hypothetical protein